MNDKKDHAALLLKGLHCAACVNRVETYLKKIDGVSSANVNLATQKAFIEYDKSKASLEDLKKAVIDSGYEVIDIDGKKKKFRSDSSG
jgi:P-type Cu+ transporter